ncbi:hypothetical protein CR513_45765, partial [Mucuna pruriens]
MVSNTQRFRTRGAGPSRVMNEAGIIDNLRLENQLIKLTSLVRQLAVGQDQQNTPGRVCQICTLMENPMDMCPALPETEMESAKIVGAIVGSNNLPSQTIPNPKGGNASVKVVENYHNSRHPNKCRDQSLSSLSRKLAR